MNYQTKLLVALCCSMSTAVFADVVTFDRVPIPGFIGQGIIQAAPGTPVNSSEFGIVTGGSNGVCTPTGTYTYSQFLDPNYNGGPITIPVNGVNKAVTVTWKYNQTGSPPNMNQRCVAGLNNLTVFYRTSATATPSVTYQFSEGFTSWAVDSVQSNVPGISPTCTFANANSDAYLTCTADMSEDQN